jgi:HAD superfamily hydrolase (TIGR01490 family)
MFYHHGLISRRNAVRGACAQLTFRLTGASHRRMERVREQVGRLCRGWPATQVSEIVTANLAAAIGPYIYAEARRLVAEHLDAGHDVVIVSTSGQEMVDPIGGLLGASAVIATQMEIQDGRYTGRARFYAYGPSKAQGVRELAERRGYRLDECYAYSDSVTDLPLLEVVGHPHAVNPDRALRKVARARGWPVLAFRQTQAARWRPGGAALPTNGDKAPGNDPRALRM